MVNVKPRINTYGVMYKYNKRKDYASVAQSVERHLHTVRVVGPIPTRGTKYVGLSLTGKAGAC